MRQNFAEIDDTHSLITIPPGQHPCQISETRVHMSKDGSPRWSLQWKVIEGPLAGKTAAWDNLTWSNRGLARVKQVLGVLGFDVSGVLELEPDELIGLRAMVQVEREEYEDPVSGRRIERLTVPYRGYEPLPDGLFLGGEFEDSQGQGEEQMVEEGELALLDSRDGSVALGQSPPQVDGNMDGPLGGQSEREAPRSESLSLESPDEEVAEPETTGAAATDRERAERQGGLDWAPNSDSDVEMPF